MRKLLVAALTLLPTTALAHPGLTHTHDLAQSLAQGFVHPLGGLDHVLAMVAVGLLVSAANVYARDTQHLLDMLILGWFWLTPIVFDYGRMSRYMAGHGLPEWAPLINPVTSAVIVMQRAIYGTAFNGGKALLPDGSVWWYLRNLGIVALASIVLLYIALRVFDRAEVNMAESL